MGAAVETSRGQAIGRRLLHRTIIRVISSEICQRLQSAAEATLFENLALIPRIAPFPPQKARRPVFAIVTFFSNRQKLSCSPALPRELSQ
jgi:hypothetical protein